MNVLAEKQKELYENEFAIDEYLIKEKIFLELYYRLRNREEQSPLGKMTLRMRKRIHKFILAIYKVKNRIGGFDFEIIHDGRSLTNHPIIFAVTHVGKFDIEVISEAIRDHYYLLSGDYEHIQGIIDAPFLNANGVIYFNEKVRSDRCAVSQKMIEHLRQGGNLMYFPEGTWNLSPNLPMLPCYWGIVDVAQKGKAVIVPIAAEQYDKHFVINIGSNFDMNKFGTNKIAAIKSLRDVLATLKWEIWENRPQECRCAISNNEWEEYVKVRFEEWPYFNAQYINGLIFKPKGITEPTEAFKHLSKLIPKKENAFLFRKQRKYCKYDYVASG